MRTLLSLLLLTGVAYADDATIEEVTARHDGGDWTFSVTLSHGDTGWDDYADGWRVVMEDGTVLGTRVLLHPHVNEQPFTRSMGGISVPKGGKRGFHRSEHQHNRLGYDTFPNDAEVTRFLPKNLCTLQLLRETGATSR